MGEATEGLHLVNMTPSTQPTKIPATTISEVVTNEIDDDEGDWAGPFSVAPPGCATLLSCDDARRAGSADEEEEPSTAEFSRKFAASKDDGSVAMRIGESIA